MESISDINEQLHAQGQQTSLFQQQDYVGSSCHFGIVLIYKIHTKRKEN